jgi:hypothetical protein
VLRTVELDGAAVQLPSAFKRRSIGRGGGGGRAPPVLGAAPGVRRLQVRARALVWVQLRALFELFPNIAELALSFAGEPTGDAGGLAPMPALAVVSLTVADDAHYASIAKHVAAAAPDAVLVRKTERET